MGASARGYAHAMAARDEDDDWVGTPPEGRHSADRAKPDFWRSQNAILPGVGFTVLLLIVLALILLT